MVVFKLFLILVLTLGFVVFSFSTKMRTIQKLGVIIGYFALFLFVVYPQYSDAVAQFFGIGLGKDLVIYILVALTGLMNIVLYVGVIGNEATITKIIRDGAKKDAKKCR